jgi:hypothetical protein
MPAAASSLRRLRSRLIISVSRVVIAMSFLLVGRGYRNLTTVRQNGLGLIWWLLLHEARHLADV